MRKKIIALAVSAVMALSAVPAGAVQAREAQDTAYELIAEEIEEKRPVGGWEEPEAVYVEGIDFGSDVNAITAPVINAAPDSAQENFFAECAGVNGKAALSAEQKAFYDLIDEAATEFVNSSEDVEVASTLLSDGSYRDYYIIKEVRKPAGSSLTSADLLQTLYAFSYDHPAYYWISSSSMYTDSSIYLCTSEEYSAASTRASIDAAIISGAKAFKAKADKAEDTLDKIAVIHDLICEEVDYAYQEDGTTPENARWAHNVEGVFSDHKAVVCEGYSETFSMMMNYMDIPNYLVIGVATSEGSGGGGGHAWNLVSDDGGATYMCMDVTWDDSGNGVHRARYFGMPKTDFDASHTANQPTGTGSKWLYALPENVTDTFEGTYYYKAGYYYDSTDASASATAFADRLKTRYRRFTDIISFIGNPNGVGDVYRKLDTTSQGYTYETISYKGVTYRLLVRNQTEKVDITGATVTLGEASYELESGAAKPEPTVTVNGVKLIKDLNYTVSYSGNDAAGTATVTVTGCGGFTGSGSTTFEVTEPEIIVKELTDDMVLLSADSFTYDGTEKKPAIAVTYEKTGLIEGTDYTVEFAGDLVNVGTVTVTVKAKGDFSGTVSKTYSIQKKEVVVSGITAADKNYDGTKDAQLVYTGVTFTGKVTGDSLSVTATGEFEDAAPGTDKKVIISGLTLGGTSVGNYKLAQSGQQTETTASLLPKKLGSDSMTLSATKVGYDGKEQKPTVTVMDGTVVVPASEYTVAYKDNVEIGTATVTVTDNEGGNYEVNGSLSFEIYDTHVHEFKTHEAKAVSCTEDGSIAYEECLGCGKLYTDRTATKEITLAETVIEKTGHHVEHIQAENPTRYKEGNIEYWVCANCFKYFSDPAGIVEITEEETKIPMLKNIENCTVSGLGTKVYTGSEIKPSVSVKDGATLLKKGTDYEVSYKDNTKVGTAYVIVKGIGDYAGTLEKKFLIKQVTLKYRAYVQKKNWMDWTVAKVGTKTDEKTFAGTTDNLRMETIQMQLSGVSGAVQYRAYVEKNGWTQWATTADKATYAGTKGKSKRVEMIQIKASGQVATLYDMYYRTYCEKFGWLGWAGNNEKSGSAGYARKLEAFQVQFVAKGTKFDKGTRKAFYDVSKDGKDAK